MATIFPDVVLLGRGEREARMQLKLSPLEIIGVVAIAEHVVIALGIATIGYWARLLIVAWLTGGPAWPWSRR